MRIVNLLSMGKHNQARRQLGYYLSTSHTTLHPADTSPRQQSFLCNGEVHKISKASELPNLDLYLTDPTDSIQEAERLPHPTMSLFMRPDMRRYPKLAAGRVVIKEKVVTTTKTPAAARKAQGGLPDDVARLKEVMAQAKTDKMENACVALDFLRKGLELTCAFIVPRSSMPP